MNRARIAFAAALITAVVAGILIFRATTTSQERPEGDMPAWLSRQLTSYQELLDSPGLPADKRAQIEREMANLVAAWRQSEALPSLTPHPEKVGPLPTAGEAASPTYALPHRPAGAGTIIESGQAPFSPMEYLFQNQWVEQRKDGRTLRVYAGAQGSALDPSGTQGVVVVVVVDADGRAVPAEGGAYPTPSRVGTVRITDADGEVLALTAADGSVLHFDVGTRAYVD